jgi:hypothetical protein
MLPPGLLLTLIYRRMTWHAIKFRAYWDLARLPMRYLLPGEESAILVTGEKYGFKKLDVLPSAEDGQVPWLIPESAHENAKEDGQLYYFGVLEEGKELPVKSKDPFVSFGLLRAEPYFLARRYAIKAYTLEALAWLVLILGICVNVIFIYLILFLLRGL